MGEGDIIAVFDDKLGPTLEVLDRHGAVPAATVNADAAAAPTAG